CRKSSGPALRHQPHAIVERRDVGGRAEVERVGRRADRVGDGEDGGEVVGDGRGALECVGLAGTTRPSYAKVVCFAHDRSNLERGRAVGWTGADLKFLQVAQAIAVEVAPSSLVQVAEVLYF